MPLRRLQLSRVDHTVAVIVLLSLTGCGIHFEDNIEVAQRRAQAENRELFVFYKSWMSPASGNLQRQLGHGVVQRQLANRVCCVLDQMFEPNREFVSRYGIAGEPALLLIRPDGSFDIDVTARRGEEVARFLESAVALTEPPAKVEDTPPVAIPDDPPPDAKLEWSENFSEAARIAQASQRCLFVVYNSTIGGVDPVALDRTLTHPHVVALLKDCVLCHLDWQHTPNRMRMAQYGITNVPGFVLIDHSGEYHAIQGLLESADLAQFLQQARDKNP